MRPAALAPKHPVAADNLSSFPANPSSSCQADSHSWSNTRPCCQRYTLLRTPADAFFPREQYAALQDALLEFGERRLGCRGMSPAWVACYIDGCRQARPARAARPCKSCRSKPCQISPLFLVPAWLTDSMLLWVANVYSRCSPRH